MKNDGASMVFLAFHDGCMVHGLSWRGAFLAVHGFVQCFDRAFTVFHALSCFPGTFMDFHGAFMDLHGALMHLHGAFMALS